MSVKTNWERLLRFWQELDFDTAKKHYYELRVSKRDNLEFSPDDIEKIEKLVSVHREFKPATDDEIFEVEKKLNVKLPIDFKESLQINNHETAVDIYLYSWLGGGNHMLECKDMVTFSLDNREMFSLDNRELDFEVFDQRINLTEEYTYWNDKWVIIFDWNMDYLAVLDLREDPKYYGKVLCTDIEFGKIAKWADSYADWFEIVTNEVLEYGELRLDTISSLFPQQNEIVEEPLPPLTPELEALDNAVKGMLQNDGWSDETMKAFENMYPQEMVEHLKKLLPKSEN